MKLGLTLPSFVRDPLEVVTVARAAEAANLDGVFAFDHLYRVAPDGHYRPALDCVALLGAVGAATERVVVGSLVARASLRPAASLRAALETLIRIAPGRLVAGIGAGDSVSQPEGDTFGLGETTATDRVRILRQAVLATRDRGFPVWVGGNTEPVRAVAAETADGWNQWGSSPVAFGRHAAALRRAAVRPNFSCTWGGLVVLGDSDGDAADEARRLRGSPSAIVGGPDRVAARLADYAAVGADWIIVGPVEARDPRQATLLGEQVAPRLRVAAPAPGD